MSKNTHEGKVPAPVIPTMEPTPRPSTLIDTKTISAFPNLVVVNFDTESAPKAHSDSPDKLDGSMSSLQFLNLNSDEISAMKTAKQFTWLNIKEKEWEEICGGGKSCSMETMNRNICDYLELQKELWRAATCAGKSSKLKSNLTVNKQVQSRFKKERKLKKRSRRLPSQGEFDIALQQIKEDYKKGFLFKVLDAYEMTFGWEKSFGVLRAGLELFSIYFLLAFVTFVIVIPLIFTEEEYETMSFILPKCIRTSVMSWINRNLAFLPGAAPPPLPRPNSWYQQILKPWHLLFR